MAILIVVVFVLPQLLRPVLRPGRRPLVPPAVSGGRATWPAGSSARCRRARRRPDDEAWAEAALLPGELEVWRRLSQPRPASRHRGGPPVRGGWPASAGTVPRAEVAARAAPRLRQARQRARHVRAGWAPRCGSRWAASGPAQGDGRIARYARHEAIGAGHARWPPAATPSPSPSSGAGRRRRPALAALAGRRPRSEAPDVQAEPPCGGPAPDAADGSRLSQAAAGRCCRWARSSVLAATSPGLVGADGEQPGHLGRDRPPARRSAPGRAAAARRRPRRWPP